jgi:hypothetical protein
MIPFLLPLACASASIATASPVHNFVYFARERENISDPEFLSTARLEGAQLLYAWGELESEQDVYDFSAVQQDLESLASKGKRLFVQIQATTFDPAQLAIPKYLKAVPAFHGGVVLQYDDRGNPAGWVVMLWDSAVRARFQKLLAALGDRFDGKIEGVALQETAIDITAGGHAAPAGYSDSNYRDAILSDMFALRAAFPRSMAMQYANFMPGEWLPDDDHGYLQSVFQYGVENGIAIGAPDLMPKKTSYQNHAYKLMSQLKGRLPLGVAVQDGNYIGRTNDTTVPTGPWPDLVPDLAQYATDFLGVNYIFWGAQQPFFSHDVVPFFRP